MGAIGFSTGSLALANFRLGLAMTHDQPTSAIELSALRDSELVPLVESLDSLDLRQFSYVSVHAPSRYANLTEADAIGWLRQVADRGWPIIVHPDAIDRFERWSEFGDLTCIENMDKRKRMGRTAAELELIFRRLPEASLCFDIGHARQVDPTMYEAELILKRHGRRLTQLHVSDVSSQSTHEPLSHGAMLAFRRVAHLIPIDVPMILETPVPVEDMLRELRRAEAALRTREVRDVVPSAGVMV